MRWAAGVKPFYHVLQPNQSRDGDVMMTEVPADAAPSLVSLWGQNGLVPIFIRQDARLAPRRAVNMRGLTVVCDDHGHDRVLSLPR
jgi:hypothetical protein